MDQDATWYEGRSRPMPHCVRQGPGPPPRKGHSGPSLFGPGLLWPQLPISAIAELLSQKPNNSINSGTETALIGVKLSVTIQLIF